MIEHNTAVTLIANASEVPVLCQAMKMMGSDLIK